MPKFRSIIYHIIYHVSPSFGDYSGRASSHPHPCYINIILHMTLLRIAWTWMSTIFITKTVLRVASAVSNISTRHRHWLFGFRRESVRMKQCGFGVSERLRYGMFDIFSGRNFTIFKEMTNLISRRRLPSVMSTSLCF